MKSFKKPGMKSSIAPIAPIAVTSLLMLISMIGCSSLPEQPDEISDKLKIATEYAKFGNDYYNQGLYERAFSLFQLSLAYHGAIDNQKGIAQTYNSIGKVLIAQGLIDEALTYFYIALEIARENDFPEVIAQSLNNIGEFYIGEGDFEKALEYFKEAASYYENNENEELPLKDKAIIYHNLGTVYKRLERWQEAIDYFLLALGINEPNKYYEEAASNNYMIASIYSKQGEYDKAIDYLNRAIFFDKKMENSLGIAKDYLALGIVYEYKEDIETAYNNYKRCLYIYDSLKIIYPSMSLTLERKSVLERLIDITEKIGDHSNNIYYKGLFEKL